MKTRISLTEFPAAGPFLQAYADPAQWADGPLARWFHYNPHDPQCFEQRIAELEARPADPGRAERAEVIAQQQVRWGAGEAAVAAARSLADPRTFTVVTGQQTGLFGGPLYSQLKAITVIKLARQLKHSYPQHDFVPCFWMPLGDSDFDEVRRTHILDRAGEVHELALPPENPGDEGLLVAERRHPDDLAHLLSQLAGDLPGGEHRDEVLAALQECYSRPAMWEGFARWMARLFQGTGLVLVNPLDPSLLSAASPLIRAEIERAPQLDARLRERNAELAVAGQPVQVEQQPGDTSLFWVEASRREKIAFRDGGFELRRSGRRMGEEELLAAPPGSFVPGVMLNPIYQDALLSPVAFVGGPAEIAYRAQVSAMADLHGLRLAPAFFRASATLLPEKAAAALDEVGWELTDLYMPRHELGSRAVASDKPAEIQRALGEYLDRLHSADARLRELAVRLDPQLEATFDTLRGNLIHHVDKLDKKITASLKRQAESRIKRLEQAHALAYPRHSVQERELNLLSFLPRYGFGLVGELIERLEVPCWCHQVVVL